MTATWTPWNALISAEPNRYIDWNEATGGILPSLRSGALGDALVLPEIPQTTVVQLPGILSARSGNADMQHQQALVELMVQSMLENFATKQHLPPVPESSLGPDGTANPLDSFISHVTSHLALPGILMPDATEALPPELEIDEDTVITGIIDVGLPLGHRRTRLDSGKTRVLAAWQQTASRTDLNESAGTEKLRQFYLPFGREVLAAEIDAALTHFSGGDPRNNPLDEPGFNAALRLVDFETLTGQRDLARRASHGAHVLDTAVGRDPSDQHAHKHRIIAINMPDRGLVGHGAEFLGYFAALGIIRVVMLADALWQRNATRYGSSHRTGYPIVINLSFGKAAPTRGGYDLIPDLISTLNARRGQDNRPPVLLSVPAGNENLQQGNVQIRLSGGSTEQFTLRVPPSDQSASFVEIRTREAMPLNSALPLLVEIEPPGHYKSSADLPGASGMQQSLVDTQSTDPIARLYFDRYPETSAFGGKAPAQERLSYLLAIKQTELFETTALAPSGDWQISVTNTGQAPLDILLTVQTDQSEEPRSQVNRRAKFATEDYHRYDSTGRAIDSYDYPLDGSTPTDTDGSAVLQRHGTFNALGSPLAAATGQSAVFLGAGHRRSDGRMMPYSATGFRANALGGGGTEPCASAPIRDGAAQPGTFSAGARDGSRVAMEGTSFAAAQLSCRIADIFLSAPPGQIPNIAQVRMALDRQARSDDTAQSFPGQVMRAKAGAGRLHDIPRPGVSRS
ncbi:hypothetical protein [Litorisediminicola beolgyonensis]|uniref:Peptidase S8/S53 domain-containing protein n=1 Tax=Litorisediminicola beolgyonensis TaxID=1173614 RepID=A0ABW3ZLD7_9RHOB